MRLLYPRLSDDDPRLLARVSQPDRGGNPGGPGGSPLSMHRLSGNCGGRRRRGAEAKVGNPHARSAGLGRSSGMKTHALLQARSLNRRIGNYLRQPRAGYILATFDRSSYLDMDGQIVALITPVLLNGPLNIVVDAETFHDRVAAGDTATSTDRGLRAGGIEIELAGAIVWDATLPLYADTADRMRHAIVSGVRNRTTHISMAYLEAAARGEASEAWHRLVDAVAENDPDRIAAAARGVMAFGETSGSDMLAGFVLAAEALP